MSVTWGGLDEGDLPALRALAGACLAVDGGLPTFAEEPLLGARLARRTRRAGAGRPRRGRRRRPDRSRRGHHQVGWCTRTTGAAGTAAS